MNFSHVIILFICLHGKRREWCGVSVYKRIVVGFLLRQGDSIETGGRVPFASSFGAQPSQNVHTNIIFVSQADRPLVVSTGLPPFRSAPGIEPGTTSTRKRYHAARPRGRKAAVVKCTREGNLSSRQEVFGGQPSGRGDFQETKTHPWHLIESDLTGNTFIMRFIHHKTALSPHYPRSRNSGLANGPLMRVSHTTNAVNNTHAAYNNSLTVIPTMSKP